MIGKATSVLMPSRRMSAIHGAYRPIPAVIKIPRMKLPMTPITSIAPLKPLAVPTIPNGPIALILHKVTAATIRSAIPMMTRIFIISMWEIIFAPRIDPRMADPIIRTSVRGSTLMRVIVIVASTQIGIAKATFKVPGIRSSEIDLLNFHAEVAIA